MAARVGLIQHVFDVDSVYHVAFRGKPGGPEIAACPHILLDLHERLRAIRVARLFGPHRLLLNRLDDRGLVLLLILD